MAYYFSPLRQQYGDKEAGCDSACVFCDPEVRKTQIIRHSDGTPIDNEHYLWVVNFYPKFEGHTMLIPKRHLEILEQETPEEVYARHHLMSYASRILAQMYESAGVEIFLQSGPGSAATIKHLHWHMVPAKPNDPLRSFEKMGHFFTTEKNQEKVILFPIKIEKAREELQEALTSLIQQNPYQPLG